MDKIISTCRSYFVKSIGNLDYKQAEYYEYILVLKYMKKYGWENVRGGYFTYCDNETHFRGLQSHKKRNTFKIDFIYNSSNSI